MSFGGNALWQYSQAGNLVTSGLEDFKGILPQYQKDMTNLGKDKAYQAIMNAGSYTKARDISKDPSKFTNDWFSRKDQANMPQTMLTDLAGKRKVESDKLVRSMSDDLLARDLSNVTDIQKFINSTVNNFSQDQKAILGPQGIQKLRQLAPTVFQLLYPVNQEQAGRDKKTLDTAANSVKNQKIPVLLDMLGIHGETQRTMMTNYINQFGTDGVTTLDSYKPEIVDYIKNNYQPSLWGSPLTNAQSNRLANEFIDNFKNKGVADIVPKKMVMKLLEDDVQQTQISYQWADGLSNDASDDAIAKLQKMVGTTPGGKQMFRNLNTAYADLMQGWDNSVSNISFQLGNQQAAANRQGLTLDDVNGNVFKAALINKLQQDYGNILAQAYASKNIAGDLIKK